MLLGFLNPFKKNTNNLEITKPLISKVFKSAVVLCTSPLSVGSKIYSDKYSGSVYNMNIWYVELREKGRRIFIPTSNFYDKTIEIAD